MAYDQRTADLEAMLRSALAALAWDHPGYDYDCLQCTVVANGAALLGVSIESVRP